MSWVDEIQEAMERGSSPFTVDDFLSKLRCGEAQMWVSGDLHGSVFLYADGAVEVGHMAGVWTDEDGAWIIERCKAFLKALGYDSLPVNGRPGWARFLRMKGYMQ